MPDAQRSPDAGRNQGYFYSDCDLLEIREEDTKPGPPQSEAARKRLRDKYSPKNPPSNGPQQEDPPA